MEHINPRYLQAIDAKGRLQLTREIRSEFRLKKGDKLYLLPSPGNQPHLQIRTAAQWKLFMDEFFQQAPSGAKRDYRRFVELSKETAVSDAQGRIGIPGRIRDTCTLDGKVLVINMGTCVEVWNPSSIHGKYDAFVRAVEKFNDSMF